MGFCLVFIGISNVATAQKAYFQQRTDYKISVALDDKNHMLTGKLRLRYTNNAPEALDFLYFQFYPNAYSKPNTAFGKQQLRVGSNEFYFAENDKLGYMKGLNFSANGQPCRLELDKRNPDYGKVFLPKALQTGETLEIETPFEVKLSGVFSRGGHIGQKYLVSQWFPKPSVYDTEGWHPLPYLDLGEFYAEYGDYDVEITLPENYVLAATGALETESERAFLEKKVAETKSLYKLEKLPLDTAKPASSKTMKTVRYTAQNVVDFAWFADKTYGVLRDEAVLKSGKKVETWSFFNLKEARVWENSAKYVKQAVEFYSAQVGEYPYPQATSVQSSGSSGGGMEYPMITLLGGSFDAQGLDIVTAHEVGHNWFQAILGSNERDHAWLDEGLNSYYEHRYTEKYYGVSDVLLSNSLFKWLLKGSDLTATKTAIQHQVWSHQDQSPNLTSDSLTRTNYFLNAYEKPAFALKVLEEKIGAPALDALMQGYFEKWKFKHPQPRDFRAALGNSAAEVFFSELEKPGFAQRKTGAKPLKFNFLMGIGNTQKTNIYYAPAFAGNAYDGVMAGIWLHNGVLPMKNFEWSVMPLYSTRRKDISGLANFDYHTFIGDKKLTIGLGARRFGFDALKFPKDYLAYTRLTPSITLGWGGLGLSKTSHAVQVRHIKLWQQDFRYDSLGAVPRKEIDGTAINEAIYSGKNVNALGNTTWRIGLEHQEYDTKQRYLRLSIEAAKDFAFQTKKKFSVRVFAGSFLINTRSESTSFLSEITRGSLSLLAQRGNTDYRFDDLWLGRGEESGFSGQHIASRTEGGMKFRLPANQTTSLGFSNRFVAALNLSTDLPLPLPDLFNVKPYFDLGYYAQPRQSGVPQTNSTLMNGGLELNIGNIASIYFPVYFSGKPFAEDPNSLRALMSNLRYAERMTFSLRLKDLNLLKILQKGISSF
jgi:hypothetical protein